jgi:hypothetical protein
MQNHQINIHFPQPTTNKFDYLVGERSHSQFYLPRNYIYLPDNHLLV